MYVIIDDETGARFCQDKRFREFCGFGTYPECVKVYKSRGWALRWQDIFASRGRNVTVQEVKVGQAMDASGRIFTDPD